VELWLHEAGRIAVARQQDVAYRLKHDRTPVTAVDEHLEAMLVDHIRSAYPGHSIIGEEGANWLGSSDLTWAIDPLDGTRSYASGLPVWAVSAGLLRGGEPYAGGVYLPAVDRMYWADSRQAWRGARALGRGSPTALEDVRSFIALPANAHQQYAIDFPRVRSFGSTLAHLIFVADSTAVAALTRRVAIWDLAGALPLLARCGVALAYLSGAPFDAAPLLDGRALPEPLLVARPEVFPEVRRRIRPI
jgi:fructose-1,6-bisphosphatase/inositol monophosphatase family enzyme